MESLNFKVNGMVTVDFNHSNENWNVRLYDSTGTTIGKSFSKITDTPITKAYNVRIDLDKIEEIKNIFAYNEENISLLKEMVLTKKVKTSVLSSILQHCEVIDMLLKSKFKEIEQKDEQKAVEQIKQPAMQIKPTPPPIIINPSSLFPDLDI